VGVKTSNQKLDNKKYMRAEFARRSVLTKLESTHELGNRVLLQTLHSPKQSWPTTKCGAKISMDSCVQTDFNQHHVWHKEYYDFLKTSTVLSKFILVDATLKLYWVYWRSVTSTE
jgi:hypothetical protein